MGKCIAIMCALTVILTAISRDAEAQSSALPKAITHPANGEHTVNCSAAYGGRASTCVPVPCSALYQTFIGTWSGLFHAYVRQLSSPGDSVYRPYHNVITYRAKDCLKNTRTGETFIMGYQTDRYPAFRGLAAKVSKGLLITGREADGTAFLRTVSHGQISDWSLAFRDAALKLVIWKFRVQASADNPSMTYTIIDQRDFITAIPHTRDVTVVLTVGSGTTSYWSGAIAYGSHSLQRQGKPARPKHKP
jgi:hypothetical protein